MIEPTFRTFGTLTPVEIKDIPAPAMQTQLATEHLRKQVEAALFNELDIPRGMVFEGLAYDDYDRMHPDVKKAFGVERAPWRYITD